MKGADQTARMRRLICEFIVRIWHKQVFSWRGSNMLKDFKNASPTILKQDKLPLLFSILFLKTFIHNEDLAV